MVKKLSAIFKGGELFSNFTFLYQKKLSEYKK